MIRSKKNKNGEKEYTKTCFHSRTGDVFSSSRHPIPTPTLRTPTQLEATQATEPRATPSTTSFVPLPPRGTVSPRSRSVISAKGPESRRSDLDVHPGTQRVPRLRERGGSSNVLPPSFPPLRGMVAGQPVATQTEAGYCRHT